jgi:CspA family cold shock protein
VWSVATGKIVRFDRARGYGFIAPDEGGEDVFLHANELRSQDEATTGARVEFSIIDGDRGLKAYAVKVLSDPDRAMFTPPRRVAAERADGVGDDKLCDVLSAAEYAQEITDVLLASVPEATGTQIMEARRRLSEHARRHGWVD